MIREWYRAVSMVVAAFTFVVLFLNTLLGPQEGMTSESTALSGIGLGTIAIAFAILGREE